MAAQTADIKDARVWDAPHSTRVIFDISTPVSYTVFSLKALDNNPHRIVVDFKSARVMRRFKQSLIRRGLVKNIRHGRSTAAGLRLVLDLSEEADPRTYLVRPSRVHGHRLVIDLIPKNVMARKLIRPASSPEMKSPLRVPTPHRALPPPVEARDVVVAIDAGHGGDDSGAVGLLGTREKDVALNIAKELANALNRQKGLRAVLVRERDYSVALEHRRSVAKDQHADLFISIHTNSAPRRSAQGISVYTLSKRGATTQAARLLAERENQSDEVGGEPGVHKDHTLSKVLMDLSQTSTLEASQHVARSVLDELRKVGKIHGQGLESAGFVVLKSHEIPSILIETGFISNPVEELKLRSPEYQKKMALSITRGVLVYLARQAPPNTLFSRRRHILAEGETLTDVARKYAVSPSELRVHNGLKKNEGVRPGEVLNIPSPTGS